MVVKALDSIPESHARRNAPFVGGPKQEAGPSLRALMERAIGASIQAPFFFSVEVPSTAFKCSLRSMQPERSYAVPDHLTWSKRTGSLGKLRQLRGGSRMRCRKVRRARRKSRSRAVIYDDRDRDRLFGWLAGKGAGLHREAFVTKLFIVDRTTSNHHRDQKIMVLTPLTNRQQLLKQGWPGCNAEPNWLYQRWNLNKSLCCFSATPTGSGNDMLRHHYAEKGSIVLGLKAPSFFQFRTFGLHRQDEYCPA